MVRYSTGTKINKLTFLKLCSWNFQFKTLCAFLRAGSISKYLPQPFLRGFSCGASFQAFIAQFQHIFGIYQRPKVKTNFLKFFFVIFQTVNDSNFKWFKYFVFKITENILDHFSSINWTAVIISSIAIPFLILGKTCINDKYKKQLRNIPIPNELIVVSI